MEMFTDKKNGQTNRWNYTNFESNLAMRVFLSLSSLNSIGQSVFELESGNENVGGQTNGQTELHQFRKQPIYDGDLSPCQV